MKDVLTRRPLFAAALFLLAGIVVAELLPPPAWAGAVIFVVCILGTLLFAVWQRPRVAAWFAVSALVPLGFVLISNEALLPKDHIVRHAEKSADTVTVGGRIVSEVLERRTSYGAKRISFTLETSRFWGADRSTERVSGKVRVYLASPPDPLRYGDEVVLRGRLELPEGRRNPGSFDVREWLRLDGIHAVFYGGKAPPRVLRHGKGNPLQAAALSAKRYLSGALEGAFRPWDAAFLKALFLGERSGMDEEFKDLFIRTGTLHILSVSGFNIGFLIASLLFFLKPVPLARDAKLSLVLAAVWAYCLLVGWQAPVVRATFMATLFLVAQISGRRADALNTLGFAALAILLWRPRQAFDVGFQLSFLAVAALIIFVPAFVRPPVRKPEPNPRLAAPPAWKERIARYTVELFWVSFVCLAATLPLTTWNFYLVTPLSVFANMAVVPLSFLLFFSGIIFFLCSWMPQALFVPVIMKSLMGAFIASLRFFEALPGAAIVVGRPSWLLVLLLAGGTAWLLYDRRFQNRPVRALCVTLFALNIFLFQEALRYGKSAEMALTVLDVGQGDALYVEFPNGGNLLVDAGKGQDADRGRRVITPFLKSRGVRTLDAAIMSHSDEDHGGGLEAVLDEFNVKNYFSGPADGSRLYNALEKSARDRAIPHAVLKAGDRIEGLRGAELEVLNPSSRYPAYLKNDNSLVLRAVYGKTAFLLTGDIGAAAIERLVASGKSLKSDVLKVPHHGAKMGPAGEAFIRAVAPRYSVISSGRGNLYGHPSPPTLSLLRASGSGIERTDELGAIRFTSDGTSVQIESPNKID